MSLREGDLLAWMRSNKVASTVEAAVRKGHLFMTVFDTVVTEAFWINSDHEIVGMVERAPVDVAIARLGIYEIQWLPVAEAASARWSDLGAHRQLVQELEAVFTAQIRRCQAAVDATELARTLGG